MNTRLSRVDAALLFQVIPGAGAATYWKIRDLLQGDVSQLFSREIPELLAIFPENAHEALRKIAQQGKASAYFEQVQRIKDIAAEREITLIAYGDDFYPSLLKEIKRPPPLLYARGNPAVLEMPQIAIVGSRSPTAPGKENARNFAKYLAANGLAVTSGLALGVDALAHRGALDAEGKTVAVLGSGVDQLYPQRNRRLALEIIERGGVVVSEFPLGTGALRENFPQRNRIISGLSCGTLVVEAAVKSGSLITARYALEQDREVFAIPGSIHNPLARGCHALIKDGAKLVETASDIIEELGAMFGFHSAELRESSQAVAELIELDPAEKLLLEALGYDGASIDMLVDRTGIAVADLSSSLMTLELKGLVEDTGQGYMRV